MRLLTISNLYPRPDKPQRGLFNYQLFGPMSEQLVGREGGGEHRLVNFCPVPEWKVWKWNAIGNWNKTGFKTPSSKFDDIVPTRYFPVFYLPVIGRNWSWRFYYNALKSRRKTISDFDVLFSTWLYPDCVVAMKLAHKLGKPGWIIAQGSDVFHLDNAARRVMIIEACDTAQGTICVSDNLKEALVEVGADDAKIHVVDNGVDGEIFRFRSRDEAAAALGNDDAQLLARIGDTKVILFVGNLVDVKSIDVLIESFAKSQTRGAGNLALIIMGYGVLRKKLENLAANLGVGGSVHFVGARRHSEVALWMNVADCLCLSSRSEGMPNVVVEALVSGLPPVTTDVGACRKMLADEPNSRVVPPGDPDKMAVALGEILEIDVDRAAMAERLRGRYSWNRMAETILNLIG